MRVDERVCPGPRGERHVRERQLLGLLFNETGQAEVVGGVETPAPGVAGGIDGERAVEGHGVGQRGDRDTGRELDFEGLRFVGRQLAVAELAVAVHPPAVHGSGRGTRVAVGVRGGDLHDPARDTGNCGGRLELELGDCALVPDDSPAVDGGACGRGSVGCGGRAGASAGGAAGTEHQCGDGEHGHAESEGPAKTTACRWSGHPCVLHPHLLPNGCDQNVSRAVTRHGGGPPGERYRPRSKVRGSRRGRLPGSCSSEQRRRVVDLD